MSLTLSQSLTHMGISCWQLKSDEKQADAVAPSPKETATLSWSWDSIELLQSSDTTQHSLWCIGEEADYTQLSLPEKQLLIKMQQACQCAGHPIIMFKDTGTCLGEAACYEALQEQMQMLSAQHCVVFSPQWAERLAAFQVQVHQLPSLQALLSDAALKKQAWQQLKRIFNL